MNYIKLRKNNLCVENISALKLAKKFRTPFYCYSLSQLKNNYYTFNNAFKTVKPIICFSVKSKKLRLSFVVVSLTISIDLIFFK